VHFWLIVSVPGSIGVAFRQRVGDGRRLEGRMADRPIDPGFVPPRFANVDIELDLAADRDLATEER